MTARELEARHYSRRCRQRRRARRSRQLRITAAALVLCALALMGYMSACDVEQAAQADPVLTTAPATLPEPAATVEPTPEPTPEPSRTRDDIVSGDNLLSYELQEVMQACCEKYEVPYALALAIAETETHFDPDAVSPTGDYGLMQINICNHEWLLDLGLDPLTHAGNVEAGIYIISQHLQAYGEPELALMAYNCGPSGARRLWDAGTYQTDYSRKVMTAYEYWTGILEE